MKNSTKNIATVTEATKAMCLAAKTVLSISIDASKSNFYEVFNLLNAEYRTYKGMSDFQAEKGNFEKADKYLAIAWDLSRALKPAKPLFEASL
jgi:hypothetical protein